MHRARSVYASTIEKLNKILCTHEECTNALYRDKNSNRDARLHTRTHNTYANKHHYELHPRDKFGLQLCLRFNSITRHLGKVHRGDRKTRVVTLLCPFSGFTWIKISEVNGGSLLVLHKLCITLRFYARSRASWIKVALLVHLGYTQSTPSLRSVGNLPWNMMAVDTKVSSTDPNDPIGTLKTSMKLIWSRITILFYFKTGLIDHRSRKQSKWWPSRWKWKFQKLKSHVLTELKLTLLLHICVTLNQMTMINFQNNVIIIYVRTSTCT